MTAHRAPLSSRDMEGMRHALEAAQAAGRADEVPVGAIVMRAGEVIARAENRMRRDSRAVAHAELLAVTQAMQQLSASRLEGCTLFVTLEPCAMCAGALVLARIDRLVFGAWDAKAGMCGSIGDIVRHPQLNHRPEVLGGVLDVECATLLREFFAARR